MEKIVIDSNLPAKLDQQFQKITSMIVSPALAVQTYMKGRDFQPLRMPALYVEMFNKELEMVKVTNIPAIFKENKPALAALSKKMGQDKILAMLEIFIIAINDFFDLNKTMNEYNIKETARLILSEYFSLTLTDIVYVFNQAKLGKYGSCKYSINGQQILEWFDRHFSERSEVAFKESLSQHMELTSQTSDRLSEASFKSIANQFKADRSTSEYKNAKHD